MEAPARVRFEQEEAVDIEPYLAVAREYPPHWRARRRTDAAARERHRATTYDQRRMISATKPSNAGKNEL